MLRFALAVPHSLPSFFISPSNSSFLFFHFLQSWTISPHKEAVLTSLTQARAPLNPLLTPTFPAQRVWVAHCLFLWVCSHTFEEIIHSPWFYVNPGPFFISFIYLFIYLIVVPFKARPHYFTWTSAQISALRGSRDGLLPSFYRWENWKLKNVVYCLKVS